MNALARALARLWDWLTFEPHCMFANDTDGDDQ